VSLGKARGFAIEDFGGGVVGFRFEDSAAQGGESTAAEEVERKVPPAQWKTPRD
jgi:hypothetical protein